MAASLKRLQELVQFWIAVVVLRQAAFLFLDSSSLPKPATTTATTHSNNISRNEIDVLQGASRDEPSRVRIVNNDTTQSACLMEACVAQIGQELSRAFPPRPLFASSWCVPNSFRGQESFNNKTQAWRGLILVKVPKAASSTTAGVVLRINNQTDRHCAVQFRHREGHEYRNHVPDQTFLVGSIRDPSQRALSSVWFFQLTPLNIEPTDANVVRALNTRKGAKTGGKGGFQYNYLSTKPVPPHSVWSAERPLQVLNPQRLYQDIRNLLQTYSFLIVVERMDESLTALALLLDVPVSHVLVSSAKRTNQYILSRVGRKKGQCYPPRKGPTSNGVQDYLRSKPWRAMNHADFVLYQAAHASLNATIQRIGATKFAKALAEYRTLREYVSNYCGDRLGTGCTEDGRVIQPVEVCYERDFGCGYQCIDEGVASYHKAHKNNA